ncbi:hypothetical protein NLG97_g9167 [Lecanicillium saksenae]|uniref:Uncharacterized protein n=1 Tax=Lecanicillium saksenae TaxID=468837 RepID=A0ACC1QJS7_9HYPO|nr:hypothetical protein NLG97_g9167 [Lecanicillium saksenae]
MSDTDSWNGTKDRQGRHRKQTPFQGIQEKARLLEQGMHKDKQTFQFLYKTSLRHLPAATLREDHGFVIQGLDLKTGEPAMHGNRFIEPIHPAEIRGWVNKYCFWGIGETRAQLGPLGYSAYPKSTRPFYDAETLKREISMMLDQGLFRIGNIREKESLWRRARIELDGLQREYRPNCHWAVRDIFQQARSSQLEDPFEPNLTQNEHHPHVQCIVLDNEPLADNNYVSVAELTTILKVAGDVARIPQFKNVDTIPVTVFSFSNRKVRIVQGCVNFRTRKHDIRCSDIMDFTYSFCRTEESVFNVCTLLGWMVGRPVGDVVQPQSCPA